MARIPMVTRTITTTKCLAVCMDTQSQEVKDIEFTLPRTYKDEATLLKVVKKVYEDDVTKIVYIKDVETVETLYGMLETDFIQSAKILDPETRKIVEPEIEE